MSDASDPAAGPLAGVRVLDLSRVVAGPYAGRILADLGAEVVKLEPPEGDPSRQIAPRHDRGQSAFWTFGNAGKRGLCVDLRRPGGVELVLELLERADVAIENFRPDVMERLGLGWPLLRARNPKLILLSINGYGADSELANERAYAPVMHAATGILASQAEYAGQPVAQRKEAHADTIAALHGVIGVQAALRVVERGGPGQRVEVPMFDAVLTSYSEAVNALLSEPDDRRMNPIYDAGPHGAIATAGSIQHVWASVARTAGIADPVPAGADLPTKARLRAEALETWMRAQRSRAEIGAVLDRAGIAWSPVVELRRALEGSVAKERELLSWVDDRRGGRRPLVRPAVRLEHGSHRIRGPAARRGEHNADVLRDWLGCDDARVRALERAGVLLQAGDDER